MGSENDSKSTASKTRNSRGQRFLKIPFFIVNFLTWIAGGALIGIAIWIVVTENEYKHFIENQIIFIFFISLAAVLFTAGLLGTFGCLLGNSVLLKTYFTILCLVFAALVGLLVLAVIQKTRLDEIIENQWNKTSDDTRVFLQEKFDCCDVSEFHTNRPSNSDKSCFVNMTTKEIKQDCLSKLTEWLEDHQIIIAATSTGVICLLITLMAGSCYFMRGLGKSNKGRKRNRVEPQDVNNNDDDDYDGNDDVQPFDETRNEQANIEMNRKTARKDRSHQRNAWAKKSSILV